MKRNIFHVKDGDEIAIIVDLEPTVSDPALMKRHVAQVYRVIANSFGPTLKLVSIQDKPQVLTACECE
jgi:hypothetical protein